MQPITFKKSQYKIMLPEGWHDVSFEKAIRLLSNEKLTDLQRLAIVSDENPETLRKQTDLETIHFIYNSLLFLGELPIKKNPEFPKRINDIKLPWVNYYDKFDLGGCETGQVEDMKAMFLNQKFTNDLETIQVFPKLCAIYLQPIMNFEDYDHDKAMKFVKEVEQIDFLTIYNMGSFFLQRLNDLLTGSKNAWQKPLTMKMKLRRGLGNLLQRLVSMLL